MKSALLYFSVAVLASGCATQASYDWNRYDQQLYDYYKSPNKSEDFVASMEAHVRALEATGKKPAPGLYAEVGTFYFKKGDAKTAASYYTKEMNAWPESKPFMSALIQGMAKPKSVEKQ
jgi:hypothetical protein